MWNCGDLPKITCLQLILKQTMTRTEAWNFEKLTWHSWDKQEGLGIIAKICFHYKRNFSQITNFCSPWNHQITIDFLQISGGIKANHFAQIDSIMEAHFGDNYLLVLFLTLFMFGSVAVYSPNNIRISGSFVVVIVITYSWIKTHIVYDIKI